MNGTFVPLAALDMASLVVRLRDHSAHALNQVCGMPCTIDGRNGLEIDLPSIAGSLRGTNHRDIEAISIVSQKMT